MWRGLGLTLGAWCAGAVALRAVVVPAEHCPAPAVQDLHASALAAGGWIERALQPDGTYVYEYDANDDSLASTYNVVRHAGVTMSLYQLAAAGDPGALPAADRALAWMEGNLVRRDDWAAFRDPNSGGVQLGASALMLMSLNQRRLATGDGRYDAEMHEVARFLLVLQREDGSFLNRWDPSTGVPYPGETSRYATGEAFWALAMMHRFFPGEGWDRPARLVADYLSLHRDDVEQNKFPPWADQWAAYGLAEMADWPLPPGAPPNLNDDNIRYARDLAARFGFLVRAESQRRDTWWSKAIHGRQARAAGMGTWVEGLTSLWRFARIDPRMAADAPKLAERAVCAAGLLAERQVTAATAQRYARPSLVEGAWFTDGVTRMDDQQHAISGLLRTEAIVQSWGEANR
ncbi:MAG: hypothetical protein HY875_08270 [Chloroflexi bacterium]|nr:hypothetical protein [Chloroflexota bacterium]